MTNRVVIAGAVIALISTPAAVEAFSRLYKTNGAVEFCEVVDDQYCTTCDGRQVAIGDGRLEPTNKTCADERPAPTPAAERAGNAHAPRPTRTTQPMTHGERQKSNRGAVDRKL